MPRILSCLAVALVTVLGAQPPDPRVRDHVDALVKALSSGSADDFEAMAQAHFAPSLLAARSPDDRRGLARNVFGDFGPLAIQTVVAETPGELSIRARGARGGTLTLALTLEPAAPFRIARLGLEAGDVGDAGGGRGGPPPLPPPSINPAMTPDALSRELDGYLTALSGKDEFAGVVLVAKDGASIFQKAYGIVDRDRHTPMTPDLRFNVASIGKALTKVAIGQLVAAGRLSLSDTIASRLPDDPDAEARTATVDQLLDHTAGIVDFFGPRFEAAAKDRFQSNSDYYRFIATEPPLFPPGSQNRYCNGCYIVLGEIVTRVTGMPFEQYVAERIFEPAGMTGAAYAGSGDARVAPGYTRLGPAKGTLSSNASMHGRHGSAAGGVYATAADLLAFDNAVREGRLLDATMTGWYFDGGPPAVPRATAGIGLAGGAPGANAALESGGAWTVIVLGNLDPPNAIRVAAAIRSQLQR